MKQIKTKLSNLHKLYSMTSYEQEYFLEDDIFIESIDNEFVRIQALVMKSTPMIECVIEGIDEPYVCAEKHIIMSPRGWKYMDDTEDVIDSNGKTRKILSKKRLGIQDSYDVGLDDPHMYVTANGLVHHNTFVALYLALSEIEHYKSHSKVIIVRSAVPSRDIGYLPGSIKEKTRIYESPYESLCTELYGRKDAYEKLVRDGVIEFHVTSYLRGQTFEDAIVIFDEAQSCTFHEIYTVLSRLGNNSRVILCGDLGQNDLIYKRNEYSGLIETLSILRKMPSVSFVEFGVDDIVRSGFVRELIIAKYGDSSKSNQSRIMEIV